MRLRKELVGLVLAFSLAGTVATSMDAKAYEGINTKHEKQSVAVDKVLDSEFISSKDQKKLINQREKIEKGKNSDSRKRLNKKIDKETALLKEVNVNLVKEEKKVAKKEYQKVETKVDSLVEKSTEKFIADKNVKEIKAIQKKAKSLATSTKVKPIRKLSKTIDKTQKETKKTQKELVEIVASLKTNNTTADSLLSKKYLLENDYKQLDSLKKENQKHFEDAKDVSVVSGLKNTSDQLLKELTAKQKDSESDFTENAEKSTALVNQMKDLAAKGSLTDEEKTALTEKGQALTELLALKNYQPGDLAKNYITTQGLYDSSLKQSDTRIAEAKKAEEKRQEEARKEAERQEAARQEAARQEAARQEEAARQASASQNAGPTLVGAWYQAAPGTKFLSNSGKTYGQVKNPQNFQVISAEEAAANYSPGHGNGSAKQ